MKYVSVFVLLVVVTAAGFAQPTKDPNGCNMGWAMPPDVDPRNPDIFCLPEFGRMSGVGAQYGNNIWPLGFKSRYEAVRRVNVELTDHILPAGPGEAGPALTLTPPVH